MLLSRLLVLKEGLEVVFNWSLVCRLFLFFHGRSRATDISQKYALSADLSRYRWGREVEMEVHGVSAPTPGPTDSLLY